MIRLIGILFFISAFSKNLAVDYQRQAISYILEEEPPSLDSMQQATSVGVFLLGHTNEGLLTYTARGRITTGVAEKYTITDKGATFHLRKNCLWSDGTAVKAQDFVFAWREVVNPQKASRYAFIMYPIKNAEKINQGSLPVQSLGIKALDDFTLQVEFEKPCAYFDQLVAFQLYYPVREDFYKEKGRLYATNAKNLLSNGPFIITDWQHDKKIVLSKNPRYWGADKVKLNEINIYRMTNSNATKLTEYLNNGNALTTLDNTTIKIAEEKQLLMKSYDDGYLRYIEFNHRSGRLGSYQKFRQAIQAIYDADELVNRVIATPGNKVSYSLFPSWLQGEKLSFYKEYPLNKKPRGKEIAIQLIKELKEELQVATLPPITLLTGNSPTATKTAEYLQNIFEEGLGLQVLIDKQTFKQRLEKSSKGEFDLVITGWGPDYNDPMTFGDLFSSWNLSNRGRYSNKQYDEEVNQASNTTDKKKRFQAFAKMQQIIEDNAVLIPLYENGSIYVQHPKLRGVTRTITGPSPWFKFASIKK